MGTGRFGNGGSGALGRAGSGSGSLRSRGGQGAAAVAGGADFFAWKAKAGGKPNADLAGELVRATFAQRNVASYIHAMLASEAVRGCYEELFILSVLLVQQRSWPALECEYNVPDQPGCLSDLVEAIAAKHSNSRIEAHREVASSAVLDVLTAAVRGDDDIFLDGNAAAVFAKVDSRVFQTLSGHFLGAVLHRALLRDLPSLDEREAPLVRSAVQERANFIIASFEKQYKKNQVTHRNLLQIVADSGDWFETKLRQVID